MARWLTLGGGILCAAVTAGAVLGAARPRKVTVADVASGYRSLRLMTPEPVWVNPELAMLCRGANASDVAHARVRYGPHANAQARIYMNNAAAAAFKKKGRYPAGAVIVKDKEPSSHWDAKGSGKMVTPPPGVAGMIKRSPGYDSGHGDWEYFYFENPKKIEQGRIASCRGCHDRAAGTGYVFGGWAAPNALRRGLTSGKG